MGDFVKDFLALLRKPELSSKIQNIMLGYLLLQALLLIYERFISHLYLIFAELENQLVSAMILQ